jgi:hypothetical protein
MADIEERCNHRIAFFRVNETLIELSAVGLQRQTERPALTPTGGPA